MGLFSRKKQKREPSSPEEEMSDEDMSGEGEQGQCDSPGPGKTEKHYRFYKRFTYQILRGYRPILSAKRSEIFFLISATVLLAMGIPLLVASTQVVEYRVRYDNAGVLADLDQASRTAQVTNGNGVTYSIDFVIDQDMTAPVYVVYELGTFYQNYRRYVRSYDSTQMHDGDVFPGNSACEPYVYEGYSMNESLPEQGAILPCGQISHSNFNDSFVLSSDQPGLDLSIDESSIAWASDAEHLYGNVTAVNYNNQTQYRGGNTTRYPLNQDQHWMVWQRPAAHKLTNKLYGKIFADIPKNTNITLTVTNRYNTYGFNGTKSFLLTTNSWAGGRNFVLPILYMICAGLSYIAAGLFFLSYHGNCFGTKRVPGDTSRLSWNRSS